MNHRHHIALVAGAATMLAATPLTTIFASFTWLFYSGAATVVVVGVAMLARTLRAPVWAQAIAMPAALLLFLTWVFSSGQEFLGFLPTLSTFEHFGALLAEAGAQMREESVPVGDLNGLLLLTTMGIGTVAFLVDLFAVGLRRPALAGLPMLAIYSVPVAVIPDSVSFFGFILGAAGYLWLLVTDSVDRVRRFGRRFTGEGRDVDLWEPSPLAAAGRRLGVAGLALALFLPLAIPSLSGGLFNSTGGGPLIEGGPGGPGTGATVDLFAKLVGGLNNDRPDNMIEYSTDDPSPYYLRFAVSDVIKEIGFDNRKPAGGRILENGFGDTKVPTGPGVTQEKHIATVKVLPGLDIPYLPVFLQPTGAIDGVNRKQWSYEPNTGQVYSGVTTSREKSYTFQYIKIAYTEEALRRAGPAPRTLDDLTQVPAVPQVESLVTRLTTGKTTQYDKVRALYDHFAGSNGFVYDINAPSGRSGQAIVDFLDAKRGFCVQYAVALAWLVRQAGYPSRIAFGFTRGEGQSGGKVLLNSKNLHAWTEVYFEGFGWVPFDATPSGGVRGSASQLWPWAPDPTRTAVTTSPGVGGPETETPGPADATEGPGEGATDPGAAPPAINGWLLGAAAAVVLLLALLLAPAVRRSTLRRRRRAHPPPGTRPVTEPSVGPDGSVRAPAPEFVVVADAEAARRNAHAAWAEMLDTMVDYEVPLDDAETPRTTADRLGRLLPAGTARDHAGLLGRAEERARYARAPIAPTDLNTAVDGVRKALASQATRRQRLSALLFPRSVVLRWRLAYVRNLAGTVNRFGRWRERVRMSLSPRRLAGRGKTS